MNRQAHYKNTIDKWIEDKHCSILVAAGGINDSEVFKALGFSNVMISNIDERMEGTEFQPFRWSYQDLEDLSFGDNSFDFAVVHAALHHCHSPHRALLNLYRIARRGVILFESRDSMLMRLMTRLGFTQTYEHAAVFYNACKYGGVRNSDIPNFVYRWTEREIEKTISSYAPYASHQFHYSYGYDVPRALEFVAGAGGKRVLVRILRIFYAMLVKAFPKQQNLFACYIEKPEINKTHFEWLRYEAGKLVFNTEWAASYYKPVNTEE